MKLNIKNEYLVGNYKKFTFNLMLMIFTSLFSLAQKAEVKEYGIGEKSLNKILLESPGHHLASGSVFSSFHKDYASSGGVVLNDVDSESKTLRYTYVNKTVLELYDVLFEAFIAKEWKPRIYGPYQGNTAYLDGFEVAVKDPGLLDYHLIPVEKRTEANSRQSQFCYEQILPSYTILENKMEFMQNDLNNFFLIKYGTKIKPEEVIIEGYFIKKIDDKVTTEKQVRKGLKHLGKRELQRSKDLAKVIDQFYRPNGTEPISECPYVFDEDGVNGRKEVFMPIWKQGDKLENFILALRANGLEFVKGEKGMKRILITDDPERLKRY